MQSSYGYTKKSLPGLSGSDSDYRQSTVDSLFLCLLV